jgi:hypothetical protein
VLKPALQRKKIIKTSVDDTFPARNLCFIGVSAGFRDRAEAVRHKRSLNTTEQPNRLLNAADAIRKRIDFLGQHPQECPSVFAC